MKETIKQLETAVGGLSNPSKMPGLAYGTPAKECNVGSILRNVPDSVCSKCYARKGMYVFPVVQDAQYNRLATMEDLSVWTAKMVQLLGRKYAKKAAPDNVFRWHDSGDLLSLEHLAALVAIAKALPGIDFWLPSKEYAILRKGIRTLEIPSNLIIRASAPMIGQAPNKIPGILSSTVGTGKGFLCEAYTRGGKCGDCRACWNPEIPSIDYPQH
jgi:hypothetical protein